VARAVTPGSADRDLRTLGGVIRELEDQLERMISANEALTEDLAKERRLRAAAESNRDELSERLAHAEHELAANESLHGEVRHLHHEHTRLSASIRELEVRLEVAERDAERQGQLVARLRAARADSVDEMQSVEAQFEHAMQVIARLRSQLGAASEERQASWAECRAFEERLRHMQRERDAFRSEVEVSRAALDEIRRSLVESAGSDDQSSQ
jgi:chromosome segregation ATPase